jgi:hypothetical protein
MVVAVITLVTVQDDLQEVCPDPEVLKSPLVRLAGVGPEREPGMPVGIREAVGSRVRRACLLIVLSPSADDLNPVNTL